jgi:nucleotide-binding universal stress UspA family protein
MYQKILVALDNSATAEAVFNAALALAQGTGASLLLVHSLSGQEEGSPLPLPNTMDSIYWAPGSEVNLELWHQELVRYETESLDRLRQFAHRAEAAGVTGEFRQLVGEPGKVLCKAAQAWGADLVVLGNRGRSGLSQKECQLQSCSQNYRWARFKSAPRKSRVQNCRGVRRGYGGVASAEPRDPHPDPGHPK